MKKVFVIVSLLVISLFIIGCGTGKALYGVAALCGNDRLDADEECDSPPDNSGYFTSNCNSLGFDGGRIACTADCKLDTSKCNAPAAPVQEVVKKVGCGNDQLDPGEECDSPPDNSGYFTKVCNDLGFDGGRIACTSECKLDTSGCNPKSCSEGWVCQSPYAKVYQYANCVLGNQSTYCANGCLNGACKPVCGNNITETGEYCDGSDLAGKTCADIDFDGKYNYKSGQLKCSGCQFITTSCVKPSCEERYGSGYICYYSTKELADAGNPQPAYEVGCDVTEGNYKGLQGSFCAPKAAQKGNQSGNMSGNLSS